MSTEKKVLLVILPLVAIVVIVLLSSEVVERKVAPQPQAVWIAIEIDGETLARTGRVELASGKPFRLHAVLEAKTWSGETIYYTEAKQLEIEGKAIPVEAIRPWNRASTPRILWFTVEGFTPFLEVISVGGLDGFRFKDHFRPDWPRSWSIPGDLRPRGARDLRSVPIDGLSQFGTQRFHVRIEFFGPESEITPRLRLQSPRGDELPGKSESFPTVVSQLPGGLRVPSRVFGLTQIEPDPDAGPNLLTRLSDWYDRSVAFSRLHLLRHMLDSAGVEFGDLDWVSIELDLGSRWGQDGAAPGDLLRVGKRWVVLAEDRGDIGAVDREDLCLDFDKGAQLQRVGDVFTGDGLVEWARIDFN